MENSNPQQQAGWLLDRVGHCTASRFKDVLDTLKNGAPSAARRNYAIELVTERLTGAPTQHFVSPAMQWGTENEEPARRRFMEMTGKTVDLVGFIRHPELVCGASPDGIVDAVGMPATLEIKAPTSATHLATLMNGMDAGHQAQVQGQMWLTGVEHAWFVSYDPRMPKGLDIHIQRIERDQAFIDRLEAGVRLFLAEVDGIVESLRSKAQ